MRSKLIGFVGILGLLLGASASAGVPSFVTYSGRLTDGSGWGESTEASLVFNLYDSADAQDPFWTTTHPVVAVVDGYFTVNLGMCNADGSACTVNPDEAMFPADLPEQMWVGVEVGGVETAPRQPVGRVPLAIRADRTEIVANGRRWSVNAVFRTSTAGKLTSADGSWTDDGKTTGAIGTNGYPVGYSSAKAACEIAVSSPTAHMCSQEEMQRSAQMGITLDTPSWVSGGNSDFFLNDQDKLTIVRDCQGWSAGGYFDSSGNIQAGMVWSPTIHSTHGSCEEIHPVACCDFPQ
ncbi:MAG: hypothetical protein ABIK09_03230 [Pseudomonadota bacterium]